MISVPVFTSCDLEEHPMSVMTPGNYYQSKAGINALINGIYDKARSYEQINGNPHRTTIFGTDSEMAAEDQRNNEMNWYGTTPSTGYVGDVWNKCYEIINACNYATKYIPKAADMKADEKTLCEAEARFFRAFFYYHLTMNFGDVHFSLEASEGAATNANHTPYATVWNEGIYPDLRFAVANLSPTVTQRGRVTQWAAKFLLAYALLSDQNGAATQWNEAALLLTDVIDNGVNSGGVAGALKLMSPFDVFDEKNDDKNTEVIFSYRYFMNSDMSTASNQAHMHYLAPFHDRGNKGVTRDLVHGKAWGRLRMTNWFFDLLDNQLRLDPTAKDCRYEAYFRDTWICNIKAVERELTDLTDPTKKIKVVCSYSKVFTLNGVSNYAFGFEGDTAMYCPKVPWSKAKIDAHPAIDVWNPINAPFNPLTDKADPADGPYYEVYWSMYPSLKKYDDTKRWGGGFNQNEGARDQIIFRLADAYLLASEAYLRAGIPDKALKYMNDIRRNAAYPGKESEMEITQAQLTIDFILDERARELCGEGWRWYDLKRLGKLQERFMAHNDYALYPTDPARTVVWNDKYLLRPIPQTHIDRCENGYPQNPGW
jgi:hypothetical protein